MANRLSVIATRTGDDGTTGLGTVPAAQDAPRIAALGDVDELNSAIGLLLTETLPEDVARICWRSSMICSTWARSCAYRVMRQ